jgi:hypothetical protein
MSKKNYGAGETMVVQMHFKKKGWAKPFSASIHHPPCSAPPNLPLVTQRGLSLSIFKKELKKNFENVHSATEHL